MFTKSNLKPGEVIRVKTNETELSYIILADDYNVVRLLDKVSGKVVMYDYNILEQVAEPVYEPDNFIRELPVNAVSEMLMNNGFIILSVDAWDKVFLDAYNFHREDKNIFMHPISERKWILMIAEKELMPSCTEWCRVFG